MAQRYLGDSVYVDFDGYNLILTTQNGDGFPTQEIVLELEVYSNLLRYIEELKELRKQELERINAKDK